jgi:hypothetical protein
MFRPAVVIDADFSLPLGVFLHQQLGGLRYGAATVLFFIPIEGDDVVDEPI